MDYNEFCNRVKPNFIPINVSDIMDNVIFDHVVIHKSAFEIFSALNVIYFDISPLWNNEHVHLIVESFEREPLKNNAKIQTQQIKSQSNLNYIQDHFMYCREKEHNFFCNFTFTLPSLKNRCITSILKKLDYLHDMEKLNLPKTLLKDIFQQSKSHYQLQGIDGQSCTVKRTFLEFLNQQDIVFPKKFVVWFQTKDNLTPDIPFMSDLSRFFVVYYYFRSDTQYSIKLCLKCMKFENENGSYQRNYWLLKQQFNADFTQQPMNWCHACQQVPLFQVLTDNQFDNLYTYDIYENDWYKNNNTALELLIKTDYFDEVVKLLIKTDYFEEGVKVKSQDISSKKHLEP